MTFLQNFKPYEFTGAGLVLLEARDELDRALRTVGAIYVDAHHASSLMTDWLTNARSQHLSKLTEQLGEAEAQSILGQLDHLFLTYADRAFKLPPPLDYLSTPAEQSARNATDGANLGMLGNMCLVFFYHCWEEKIRRDIAALHGVEDSEIRSEIWGDIGKIRNAITHHRAVATKESARCRKLKWFNEGDPILITPSRFSELCSELWKFNYNELQNLVHTPIAAAGKVVAPLISLSRVKNQQQLQRLRACDPRVILRAKEIFSDDAVLLAWLETPLTELREKTPLTAKPDDVLAYLKDWKAE